MTSWWERRRLKSPASRLFISTVCSGPDQRKHQSSALLTFMTGIHRWLMNFLHKGPVTRKMFPFDDVIMLASYKPIHTVEISRKTWQKLPIKVFFICIPARIPTTIGLPEPQATSDVWRKAAVIIFSIPSSKSKYFHPIKLYLKLSPAKCRSSWSDHNTELLGTPFTNAD